MKLQVKFFALVLILSIFGKLGVSQDNFASNISKSVSDDGKLIITYDIDPTNGARSFSVVLLLTYEGKQIKATAAYGDIGSNINPGKEKAIVWYYKDDFDGNIENVNIDVFAYKENEPRAIFQIVSKSNKGYAPCEIVFQNNSSYANEYQWNFGDPSSGTANISFEKDPKHIFEKGGIYSISLIARNTQLNLENTYYQSVEIKEYDPVIADFTIIGNNQMPTAKVDFENNSVNADTYRWNFGDPSSKRKNTSDKENPRHKYKEPGTFTVELIVKNNFSGLTDTITKEVVVGQVKPAEASFVYTQSSETAPSTVVFKNTTVNGTRYEWNFGDPDSGNKNSSKETDPAHVYTKPGSYKIELSAWGEGEKKPSKHSEIVTISELPKPPEARFTIQNNNVLGPATIIFQNNSVNAEEYSWDFGDPDSGSDNISKKENPTYTYKNPGRYKVVLTASSSGFTTKSTATDYVVIVEPAKPVVKPVAKFTLEKKDFTAPVTVSFENSSTDADLWEWDFGDPDSDNNTSNEANPTHYYAKAGTYTVELKVTDKSSGNTDIFTDHITINAPAIAPVADFEIKGNNAVAPAKVVFSNISKNADSYSWDFGDLSSGDLNSSTDKDPEHLYEKEGEYKVVLKVVNDESGKEDVIEKSVIVEKPLKPPLANFEFIADDKFVPVNVGFKNLSVNADTYKWNFGDFESDQNESSDKSPTHQYKRPGNYIVTLEAENSKTDEVNKVSKEITLTSSYSTFVKSDDLKDKPEFAYSSANLSGNEFLVLGSWLGKGSYVLKIDNNGKIIDDKKLNYSAYDIQSLDSGNEFMIVGVDESGKLIVQNINRKLDLGSPVVFPQNKNYSVDFGIPKLALSKTNEIGVVANTLNDRYPIDIMFQKTDRSGRIITLEDRTFKYVGTKLATDIVPIGDGGFALTGYWQENDNSPMMIIFGKIDRRGKGEIHLIRSSMNIIGCDIEESYQGGYAILRAKESEEDSNFYEISFILIAADGGPTDCANMLPCSIKKEDILMYKPAMIKIEDGYLIASQRFNGLDYDIALYWIDKTGEVLKKHEDIIIDGDQFFMDIVRAGDGGYLITGTQRVNNEHKALIIKTDPYGKVY